MLSVEEAKRYFHPEELEGIQGVVEGALEDYESADNYSPTARRDHTPAVKATIRNAHMVGRAQRLSLKHVRMRYASVRGKPLLNVGDDASVAFKKLDVNHRPRPGKTRQSRAFMGQMTLPLDMPPEATNMVAGYVLDQWDAGYETVLICPGPTENFWEIPFPRAEPDSHFTDAPRPESPATPARRVKLRSEERGNGSINGTEAADSDEAAIQ